MIEIVIFGLLGVSLFFLGSFIFFYSTRPVPGTRFRRRFSTVWLTTPIGAVLMSQKIALFSMVLFILISRITGEFPGRQIIGLVLYGCLVSLFVAVFFVLRRVQRPFEEQERSRDQVHDQSDDHHDREDA